MSVFCIFLIKKKTISSVFCIFQKKNVEIHPKPTNDFITISNAEESRTIEIFSLNGKFLETVKNNAVNLRNYPKGIYILKVNFEDRVEEVKVIKK